MINLTMLYIYTFKGLGPVAAYNAIKVKVFKEVALGITHLRDAMWLKILGPYIYPK